MPRPRPRRPRPPRPPRPTAELALAFCCELWVSRTPSLRGLYKGFQKSGPLVGSPYDNGHDILESILGSPVLETAI